jgi:zinc finger SWIM domain-containing protein 3
VLKQWTWEACSGTVQDKEGRNIMENPNMNAMLSYRYMSHKFHNLVDRASNFPECVMLVDNTLDILESKLKTTSMHVQAQLSIHVQFPQMLAHQMTC